ncbi:MAG: hypothetical protein JNL79_21680 [Myxococcales bacterium]|nr:hypothetical protein [Myxococcales bacterium]
MTPALPVVIGRNPDEGWGGDVEVPAKVLRVDEHSFVVRTHATIDGRLVELEASFEEPTQGGIGAVELRPGAGADALLGAIAKAWEQPAPTKPARKVRVAAAWLVGTARDARHSATRTKVFFEEQDAEFYVNWNPETSMLELFEKDDEYRAGVLGALTGS